LGIFSETRLWLSQIQEVRADEIVAVPPVQGECAIRWIETNSEMSGGLSAGFLNLDN
jgi:hypothetical protein